VSGTGVHVHSVTRDAHNPAGVLAVSISVDVTAPVGTRDVTVINPVAGVSDTGTAFATLAAAFEVRAPAVARFDLGLSEFVDTARYLPTVESVTMTLDANGRCTGQTITPTSVTLVAQFATAAAIPPPAQVTFTRRSVSAIPGIATNWDCEPANPASADFSIGAAPDFADASAMQQVVVPGGGVYSTTLWSADFGGKVTIEVRGVVTLPDGSQRTITETITLPIDTDRDDLPDAYERDTTLNADATGANVLDPVNGDRNGNGVSDRDDRFVRDGLTNFEKYRGILLRGPAAGRTLTVTKDDFVRLGAGQRQFFVRPRGFADDPLVMANPGTCGIDSTNLDPNAWTAAADATLATNPCPPFQVGGAFAEIGVRVHNVGPAFAADGSTVFPTRSFMRPFDALHPLDSATLDMATIVYDAVLCNGGESCDHIGQTGIRNWRPGTLGFSVIGGPAAYGRTIVVFKKPVDAYFLDRPYRRGGEGDIARFTSGTGKPMLMPITITGDYRPPINGVRDTTSDNGIVDGGEVSVVVTTGLGQPVLGLDGQPLLRPWGDYLDRNSFAADMTALDVNNDGCVELPPATDPTLLTPCDPHADVASGQQATKRMVIRSLVTHELGHSVGITPHSGDFTDAMFMYTINWTRYDHFSPESAAKVNIHNKGLQ